MRLPSVCRWGMGGPQSLVSVGQRFFSFGWESQLLETGFLAIFLCPLTSLDPLPARLPTPQVASQPASQPARPWLVAEEEQDGASEWMGLD